MSPRILILTEAEDLHAIAIAEALAMKGVDATLWSTSDFPTLSTETLHYVDGNQSIRIEGPDLSLEDPKFDVVWRRRPSYVLDHSLIHPADRAFAEGECGLFRRSLINVIAPDAFWVNPPLAAGRASSKILQHEAAMRVGLKMPETLYTNCSHEVEAFMRRRDGRLIYKPFFPTGWTDGCHNYLPYTSLLTEENLDRKALRLTPGIFQEVVPKSFEIRLTLIGNRCFAAKILPDSDSPGRLDWRQAPGELRFEPFAVPRDIEEKCCALLADLELVFGCFDFIVTPGGDYVFLEVNEMGQFLFVERECGLPLLDAFACFLLQASIDFEWREESARVHYGDPELDALILRRSREFAARHVPTPGRLVDETPAVLAEQG